MYFLVSPALGLQKDSPMKNPMDPVRLETVPPQVSDLSLYHQAMQDPSTPTLVTTLRHTVLIVTERDKEHWKTR